MAIEVIVTENEVEEEPKKPVKAKKSAKDTMSDLLADFNKEFGHGTAGLAEEGVLADVKGFLSTGSYNLDVITRGGIPLGRVVEIFGKESSGKSTLLTHLMISCQKLGLERVGELGLCVLVDYESTFSRHRAIRMGLDLKGLIELRAENLEDGFDHIHGIVKKAKAKPEWEDLPILVAFDTLAAAPTEAEKAGDKEAMAAKAKVVQQGLRKIGHDFSKHSICFVIVNQMIANPGPYAAMNTPGGNAPKFYSSVRLQCYRTGEVASAGKVIGSSHKVRVIKNKIDGLWLPKQPETTFFAHFDNGIQNYTSALHELVEAKVEGFTKSKGGRYEFSYDGKAYSLFYKDVESTFASNPGMQEWLRDVVREEFVLMDFSDVNATPW